MRCHTHNKKHTDKRQDSHIEFPCLRREQLCFSYRYGTRMRIPVLGIGTVSALGCGIETLKTGLEGKVKPAIEEHKIATADGETSFKVYKAGVSGLDRFVSRQALRRMDRFIQMALLSS